MRADALFANLDRRQSMLLLVAVSFGGAESLQALEHASLEDGEVLRERAAKFLSIPREERIQFLVQEMKRLVVGRQGGDLRGASAELVAAALKGERPALAEVLLRALPSSLASQVRNEIPPTSVKLVREVRPELLAAIRWHFERRLADLTPRGGSFLFADVHSLAPKDLLSLADHLGATEVGRALVALPTAEREERLQELSSEQRTLASRAVAAASRNPTAFDADEARELLDGIAPPDARYRVRHAGIRLIARAALAESAEAAGRLVERHRDEVGRMVATAVRSERALGRAVEAEPLQSEILAALELLAGRGVLERPLRLPPPAAFRERLTSQGSSRSARAPALPVPPPPGRGPTPQAAPLESRPPPRPAPRTSAAREHPIVETRESGRPRVISRPRSKKPGGPSRE